MKKFSLQPVFEHFLKTAFDRGAYTNDDVVAFLLPVFLEVLSFHEENKVAPFDKNGVLFINEGVLDIDEHKAGEGSNALRKVQSLFAKDQSSGFQIVERVHHEMDVDGGKFKAENTLWHLDPEKEIKSAVYLPAYLCYEFYFDHHDERSDIFCLGLLLGSMAMGLDLFDEADLKTFTEARKSPAAYHPDIHPTIAALITEMTELNPANRSRDLYDIIHRLDNYRSFDPDRYTDLSELEASRNKNDGRNAYILSKLQQRLFDTSRRNRMLYYKPNARFVNLTLSSVPMVLHYQSIRPSSLFIWNNELGKTLAKGKKLLLNNTLRFEDHPYVNATLDKIRSEARRDLQEYGFTQLKLAAVFLNWHDLKEDPQERIQTPLLFVPVELTKVKKPKQDHFQIRALGEEAEINPVLANWFREEYGIRLPEKFDLNEDKIEDLFAELKRWLEGSGQGIQLEYVDKPRLRLIHSVAKNTVRKFNRRIRRRSGLSSWKDIPYSYNTEHFRPLGLQIFQNLIRQEASYLEYLIDDDIRRISSSQLLEDKSNVKETELYEIIDTEHNPYKWEFDLCSVVLGNFNYKKMSLVQDYNQIRDEQIQHQVFDHLFDAKPKAIQETQYEINPEEWYHVIKADPTQMAAIQKSRFGESFIIQGPPGTGKSQTITNLIADYVARGKSVLFVCEKRAALDVVYFRMKQMNLDELCCYIHDSQSDKRSFIQNLKDTYQSFVKDRIDVNAIDKARTVELDVLLRQKKTLELFHKIQSDTNEYAGIEVRYLLQRLIELKEYIPDLTQKQEEALPHFRHWKDSEEAVQKLYHEFDELEIEGTLAEHPFHLLSSALVQSDRPVQELENILEASNALLQELVDFIREQPVLIALSSDIDQLYQIGIWVNKLGPLRENHLLGLFTDASFKATEIIQQLQDIERLEEDFHQQEERNANWRTPWSELDVLNGLDIARKWERSFFKFFSGKWKTLRESISRAYDFSAHSIPPSVESVLQSLLEQHEAELRWKKSLEALSQQTGLKDPFVLREWMRIAADKEDKYLNQLLQVGQLQEAFPSIQKAIRLLDRLQGNLTRGIGFYAHHSPAALQGELESLRHNLHALPELLPALREITSLPLEMQQCLKQMPFEPKELEAAMALKSWNALCRDNREYARFNFRMIEEAAAKIELADKRLMQLNASLIRARVRQKFKAHIDQSNMAVSQLSLEERKFKKDYSEGRKILENEFGKSMRYKSIRELSKLESNAVLRDLKPVWLMSPLSVSDTMPIDPSLFDVVIFDEASQITLEEGVPSLYRSNQTIIVGDEKQMPPSNFFSTKPQDPDDLEAMDDANEEWISDDTDSLLVQGHRKLNTTMLGWHYRSKHETLISFSNHAFYKAGLLTIPDRYIHDEERDELVWNKETHPEVFKDALFDRSISYHFLEEGVYEKRSNEKEAEYIATLIEELLKSGCEDSIGIVAFSQEQQNRIEDALSQKAAIDPVFDRLLEEAYNRHEDDQFIGLFVKNLENVQGDERDIIIMSVCYGYDSRKRMIMNFGPINKKGGEKRLNVLFSRAKRHMAIISSIHYNDIKNEYNEGANYFKRFLHYAELVSAGQLETANGILHTLSLQEEEKRKPKQSAMLEAIKERLDRMGYQSTLFLGQSEFRCSLAVKNNKEEKNYTLAVLVDDERHYSEEDVLAQYFQKPALLQANGWKQLMMTSKDWFDDPELVIKRIERELNPSGEMSSTPIEMPAEELDLEAFNTAESSPDEKVDMQDTYGHLVFRRWLYQDEKSNKFWEFAVDGDKVIIRYGRVGSKGQLLIKVFEDAKRMAQIARMIREKEGKGYTEISAED